MEGKQLGLIQTILMRSVVPRSWRGLGVKDRASLGLVILPPAKTEKSGQSQVTTDALGAAGAANAGAATAGSTTEVAVWVTTVGKLTPEQFKALKLAKGVAKGSNLVGGVLAVDQITSGSTTADKAHGWTNLAASVAGIGCAVSGVCGAVVGGGLAIYSIADTAVQFKEYKDPTTGEQYTGWQALYKDLTD